MNSSNSRTTKSITAVETNQEVASNTCLRMQTDHGVYRVDWDNEAPVTPHGQVAFFAQYLHTAALFTRWCDDCPLEYTSNNAPAVKDVLGTLLLSVLSGHTRYDHIDTIYGDTVSTELLDVNKTVSSDSARRGWKRMEEDSCRRWQQDHLRTTYEPLLNQSYVLDIDSSVKPLYGKQEGAVVGYNPKKRGRPSHSYHTYVVSKLRLVLDVEVHPGNESSSCYTRPGLWRLLDNLPTNLLPELLRGDIGFGNEQMMFESEERQLRYLFKLRQTNNVKSLIRQLEGGGDWDDAGSGWEGRQAPLKLDGWTRSRTVTVLRGRKQKVGKKKALFPDRGEDKRQVEFAFVEVVDSDPQYEYAVLVSNLSVGVLAIAQLYRERSDCENVFDEMKNHWGWGGFTTQDLKRSQIMARIIAPIYNWWTIFCRLAIPEKHSEAIASRPMFFKTIGRLVRSAGQRYIRLTSINQQGDRIRELMGAVSRFLDRVRSTAAQSTAEERWTLILSRAFSYILGGKRVKAVSEGRQLLLGY